MKMDFELKRYKMQIRERGVMRDHATKFWNFGTPFISREHLKLETRNLARRRTSRGANEKNI